jgi:hypothetical protein
MIAHPPCNDTVLYGRLLIGLAFQALLHDVVLAYGALIDLYVPASIHKYSHNTPHRDWDPFLYFEPPLLRLIHHKLINLKYVFINQVLLGVPPSAPRLS